MTRFRGMRWVAGGAVAVVMAVCAAGAVAASAGGQAGKRSASRGCYPKGSRTIAKDKAGRFFHIARNWYVCAFKQGTPRQLGHIVPGAGVTPWARSAKVSGRYLAVFFLGPTGFNGQPGRPPSAVAVYDMATGQRTFYERVRGPENLPPATGGNLVLKPDGSVAWMSRATSTGIWSVNRHDSTGTATVDSGPQVDPHSLAAGGSWLYWTDAGSPRSAPFH